MGCQTELNPSAFIDSQQRMLSPALGSEVRDHSMITFAAKEGTVQQPNVHHRSPEIAVDDCDGVSEAHHRLLRGKKMLHAVIRFIEEQS